MSSFIKLTLTNNDSLHVKTYDIVRMQRSEPVTLLTVNGGGGIEREFSVLETPEQIETLEEARFLDDHEPKPVPYEEVVKSEEATLDADNGPKITLNLMLDAILRAFPIQAAPKKIALGKDHYIATLPVGKDNSFKLYGHVDDFNALERLVLAEINGPTPPKQEDK